MIKSKQPFFYLTVLLFSSTFFISCNQQGSIPFPEQELGYAQPVAIPLVFTKTQKLTWDTVKTGGIKATVKKLDIETLPSTPFDSTGFQPFSMAPKEGTFDFEKLPDTIFNPSALTTLPLEFKTNTLAPPVTAKSLPPISSKNHPLSIYELGLIQGMPAKFVGCVFKDSKGFLWVGGNEGLFRYDGQHVQTIFPLSGVIPIVGITEDNENNIWFISFNGIGSVNTRTGTISTSPKIGAIGNNIGKMTKDSDGKIWVYNFKQKAVSIIDPATRTYQNLTRKNGLSDSLAFEILQDKDERIWITTYNNGVNIIDPKAGKIKHLNKNNGLSSNSLSAITTDKNDRVLLASADGIDVLDIKKGTTKYYNKLQGLKSLYTLGLTIDSKGQIWRNTIDGVELVNTENGVIRHIGTKDGLSDVITTYVVEDKLNRMWLGTLGGLNMIEQNGRTTHLLKNTNIISLMEDPLGNLWIATETGLGIVNPQRTTFRKLDETKGLSNNFVQSFTRTGEGMIVATNGGFNIINPVRKTITTIGKKEGFIKDSIYSIFPDKNGKVWFTGPENGIAVFDSSNNSILHTDKEHGLSDNDILDTKQDATGRIWLATNTNGVNIIDPATNTVSYLNDQPGLKDTSNRILLIDSYGRAWIGTYKGIYVADTKAQTITNISTQHGLSHNKILSLLEYNGSIIAGTKNKITIITAPVPGSNTDTTWNISILKGSESIVKTATSWSTDCITSKGEYLWGDDGITVFNEIKPVKDTVTTFIAAIAVMNQQQNFITGSNDSLDKSAYANRNVFKWDSVHSAYNLPVNLIIPYQKNYLQFQFGQANLGRQDTTWYAYTLEGIDKNWSAPTINTITENYLNLPPGQYTFKVSSKGVNGKWGKPVSFSFRISPPWYQTWWAYTLLVLLGAAILSAYIAYRSRMLQKENKVLEEKVALRTNQLQKSLEDLKATQTQLIQSEKMASLGELTAGIAHEIQNPLNFINNFSEVNAELIAEMKEEISKGNMSEVNAIADDILSNEEKINHHGKRADAIVKGMLQHSRSGGSNKEPTDINALCDEYLRLSYHGLRAKDKSFNAKFETDFDKTIEKIDVVPQDIGRVILNLINNAFYAVNEKKKPLTPPSGGESDTPIDYEPTVSISTKKQGGKVLISVKDNGNGIPKNVMDKIFQPFFTTKPTGQGTGLGLSLSYDIVKAHGGELTVTSKQNEETIFTITLPTN